MEKIGEHEAFSFPSVSVVSVAHVHLPSAAVHDALLRLASLRKSKQVNHVTTGDEEP